jgi:hypothetical protein
LSLDEDEKFELYRDFAEYNASFMNPEGVQQIKDARKNTYKVSDEDFNKFIEEKFGRKLDENEIESEQNSIDPYLNMDLDDVVFTPYSRG